MVEARLRPQGPYSLKLTTWTEEWSAALPEERWASARQTPDGTVVVRASCERAVDEARFVLALDHDTAEFHRAFAQDPLLGRTVRTLRGLRPRRLPTVAHAAVHAVCGQLIQSRRAREIERAVIRACTESPPSQESLARLSAAKLTGCGLAPTRAATLARIVRTIDLEGLRLAPETALSRLGRERGIGPWSVGVIALSGLGRYDAGLVGDLGLVKLLASRTGRWPEASETAALLAPYGEWQGLASVFLLAGFKRGLVPGANRDRARLARARWAA
jgi:DNA-3-methyladenine glycosylase II